MILSNPMPDGEWVYSKEESLAILERGVARCEQLVLLDSEHRSEPSQAVAAE